MSAADSLPRAARGLLSSVNGMSVRKHRVQHQVQQEKFPKLFHSPDIVFSFSLYIRNYFNQKNNTKKSTRSCVTKPGERLSNYKETHILSIQQLPPEHERPGTVLRVTREGGGMKSAGLRLLSEPLAWRSAQL